MDSDKNKKFQFSVIIPFHNQGDYLMDAVESCLRQTIGFKDNMEIILIDDASTDIGPVISEIYAEDYPDNIQYHPVKSCPITEAVKTGISLAVGKYYLILNADNFLADNALEIAWNELSKHHDETAVVFASILLESNDPLIIHPIQKNKERTVIQRKDFESGLTLLNSVNELLRICIVSKNKSEDSGQYVYLPDALLRARFIQTDLDYDFGSNLFGEKQALPYTKEDVKSALFGKRSLTPDDGDYLSDDECRFLFSIIMPVYNAELFLEEAIGSIIQQDIGFKENVQLILVDDGSRDNSGAICDKYHKLYPDNVSVIHQENSGPSIARYNGKKLAEGRYINFCDSDDLLSPNTLKRVSVYFKNRTDVDLAVIPAIFIGAKTGEHPNNTRFIGHYKTINQLTHWEYGQTNLWAAFFRRKLLPYFSYDRGLKISEDFHQLLKLQLLNPLLGLVNECAYYYRKFDETDDSLSTNLRYKPDFFAPSLERVFLDIIALARSKYGFIPRYIQLLLYRDLTWRLKFSDLSDTCLSAEDQKRYLSVSNIILSQMERSVIFSLMVQVKYRMRNQFLMMKMNGVFDLYPALIKKSLNLSPIDIWINEIPEELAPEVLYWLFNKYGKEFVITALRTRKRTYDPAGIKRTEPEYDYSVLFQNHSTDTVVRIWRNEVPDYNGMAVFNWICERYGMDEIAISLHRAIYRLLKPHTVEPIEPEPVPVSHNQGLLNKIKEFNNGIHEEGFRKTAVEYINNIFYYKYRILKKKIPTDRVLDYNHALSEHKLIRGFEPLVLFESIPDMSDNTLCVYQWMMEKGLNEKYQFVWIVEDPDQFSDIHEKNVFFVKKNTDEMLLLKQRAIAMVGCNRFIFDYPQENQISLFLTHGSPLKASPSYSYGTRFNYVLSQSEWLKPYVSYENDTPIDSLYVLGIPRNDALFHPDNAMRKLGFDSYEKVIVWLPTYRQHKTAEGDSNHIRNTMNLGIPVIQTREEAEEINAFLKERNMLLVLKPHPAQNLSTLRDIELSNFRIIYNDYLQERNVLLYEFLGESAALITDYSSVYYDYLLTGKPIGLTTDDYDIYNGSRGFVYKDPYEVLKGHLMDDCASMKNFIKDVAEEKDPYKEARRKVNDLVNTYQDDRSTERVGKFLTALIETGYPETEILPGSESASARSVNVPN